MIRIINGDILNSECDIIAHQVNCQGVAGAGVAKAISNVYPTEIEKYKRCCSIQDNKVDLLGRCFITGRIAHLFGQYDYGRYGVYTKYRHLNHALKELYGYCKYTKQSVAIPYGIGCGLAGGDWNIVYNMIKDIFTDIDVCLYKLK